MPHITLTSEQANLLTAAHEPVELRDESGKVLARVLSAVDQAALESYRRQKEQPSQSYSATVVRGRLKRLEEISQHETLDKEKARELLARMRAGEEV